MLCYHLAAPTTYQQDGLLFNSLDGDKGHMRPPGCFTISAGIIDIIFALDPPVR
jgi:hypothetical protein